MTLNSQYSRNIFQTRIKPDFSALNQILTFFHQNSNSASQFTFSSIPPTHNPNHFPTHILKTRFSWDYQSWPVLIKTEFSHFCMVPLHNSTQLSSHLNKLLISGKLSHSLIVTMMAPSLQKNSVCWASISISFSKRFIPIVISFI